jgi:hypothetical protein
MTPYKDNFPKTPPPKRPLWLIWIFVGLAPIPVGLLMGPENIFTSAQNKNNSLWLLYAVIAIVCSVACGIGQAGGFVTKKPSQIVGGILAGIFIASFNCFVVFFAGCCSSFKNI